ncbi:hypothetical protein [Merismopedia glauca]|uniref:hypothetical protein n=1 Tax=Merismopedia glauca TaxID=292586 RepID=UPI0011B2361C|nr:hypothetical protein [Merismopedia glauca]
MTFGGTTLGIRPKIYCFWTTVSILLAVALAGFSSESVTRLLVIVFLFVQIAWRSTLAKVLPWFSPKTRFIVLGTVLAAVVEGCHMISTPVFRSLRIGWDTSFTQGLLYYVIDLLFTVPAYLVIFSVIWYFINQYHYSLWHYVVVMGLAHTLGDGGIFFFLNAPQMLLFLPYPMTNYHAIDLIPFLAVCDRLRPERLSSPFAYLAVPGVIGTYLVCGTIIKLLGRAFGLE